MLGLCSFGSPHSLGGVGVLARLASLAQIGELSRRLRWLRKTTLQSVVASKVDLVGFLQCEQFVAKFALQCGCRVFFKYFVGLFVVNKRVHFVVAGCLCGP